MFANTWYFSSFFILFFYLIFTEANNMTSINPSSIMNITSNVTVTTPLITKKPLLIQGQELIHSSLTKLDRSTLVWGTLALALITCLILIYVGIKTFVLRKKRQTRRYKLLSNATTMEEPLFNGHDDDEEERDNDTLFVRK